MKIKPNNTMTLKTAMCLFDEKQHIKKHIGVTMGRTKLPDKKTMDFIVKTHEETGKYPHEILELIERLPESRFRVTKNDFVPKKDRFEFIYNGLKANREEQDRRAKQASTQKKPTPMHNTDTCGCLNCERVRREQYMQGEDYAGVDYYR